MSQGFATGLVIGLIVSLVVECARWAMRREVQKWPEPTAPTIAELISEERIAAKRPALAKRFKQEQIRAQVGYGNWSQGWACEDASGDLARTFGEPLSQDSTLPKPAKRPRKK
jgi:hypothetical protein